MADWKTSLGGSLVFSLLGTGFYLVTQLGVLSSLAHFRGPVAVGEFGLALAVTTPLFAVANMGLRTQQAVDITGQFDFADYGGVRAMLAVLATIDSHAAGWLLADEAATLLVVAVVTGAKAFESVSNLAYGAFQQRGRMDLVARSYFIRGGLTLVFFVGLLVAGASVFVAFLSQFVVWGLTAMLMDYPQASRMSADRVVPPRFSRDCVRLLIKSAPLSGASFANHLQASLPRLFIQSHLGLEQLGLFTAVGYFQRAGIVAANSVLHAIINRLAHLHHVREQGHAFKLLLILAGVFLVVGAAGVYLMIIFGDQVLRVIFGEQFVKAHDLFVIISISLVLRMLATLMQSMLVAQQRFGAFFWTQIATLIATVPLAYVLIAWFGLIGAGYALLAASGFRLLSTGAMMFVQPRQAADHDRPVPLPDQGVRAGLAP